VADCAVRGGDAVHRHQALPADAGLKPVLATDSHG